MIKKLIISAFLIHLSITEENGMKWVWSGNSRSSGSRSGLSIRDPLRPRYNVYEETDEYRPIIGDQYFPSSQSTLINQRPPPANQRPVYQNKPPTSGLGFLPEERPGGVYGKQPLPTYGGVGTYIPEGNNPGILTGPVPSWVKEGPIRDFDKCKCTEKFNCNSPGVSYGQCDTGKQYCCYSTKNRLGGPIPSKPVHSIENGVLVGPGGPVNNIPGVSYPRPPKQLGSGFYRPGSLQGPQGAGNEFQGSQGVGSGLYEQRPFLNGNGREPNEYSPANGVLVGPGGPYDSFGLGRSAKSINRIDRKV